MEAETLVWAGYIKVALYSFSIPPKCEHKLRRHKQRFGKINNTVFKWEPLIIQGYYVQVSYFRAQQ